MNILIISQYYTPDITAAAFRIAETSDLLRAAGHDIRVITALPHKSTIQFDPQAISADGVFRVMVDPIGNGGLRNYLRHYASFVWRSTSVGFRQTLKNWQPDVIWTSSPPLFAGLTGCVLARASGAPLVLDIRDIWPQSAVSAGQITDRGWAFKTGRALEKWLYQRADHITCVSEHMAEYISAITQTPVEVIYNGVPGDLAVQRRRSTTRNRILYAGNLGRVQGLDTVVRAFASVVQQVPAEWTLDFIGGGAIEAELRELARSLRVGSRIIFHPPMPKQAVMRELAESALLLINLKADQVFELTIPSKVFDYMAAGRPILFGIAGEGQRILASTGANIAFKPSDEPSLRSAILEGISNLEKYEASAAQNVAAVVGRYSREHNTAVLANVFRKLTGKMA